MSGWRLPAGGAIDRARPVRFRFDGKSYTGFAGDTLASALLAAGVCVVARSFKLHRPRGVLSAGPEEPNAIVDVLGTRHDTNLRATEVMLAEGLAARSVNAWPSAARDLGGLLDRFHRFLPSGFYYKTFMRPAWSAFEPFVRARAGLGRAPEAADGLRYDQRDAQTDVLVVGAGCAGLAAALECARRGVRAMLVDLDEEPGGLARWDASPAGAWIDTAVAELDGAACVTRLARTTAFGFYDHGTVVAVERLRDPAPGWAPERLWRIRAKRIVLATGAIERTLLFPDNDVPGVMLASAALVYLRRFAVAAGRRAVFVTNNDGAYEAAEAMRAAGIDVAAILDLRAESAAAAARSAGFEAIAGARLRGVLGRAQVAGVRLATAHGERRIAADLVCVSGGWTPTVHLFCQSGGRLAYDDALRAFVPADSVQAERSAGAARGALDRDDCVADGAAAGRWACGDAAASVQPSGVRSIGPASASDERPDRQWIDLQNDVTVADVELAAREGYVSVEHMKRYTTFGMAPDQGKTGQLNGLAVLGRATGRAVPEVGTTRFRPPYTPVPFGALAGSRRGALLAPIRRLPAHDVHVGARFEEYGRWLRPEMYPAPGETRAETIRREALAVRSAVGVLDASPLGKVEVCGPDAASFLDLMYYNRIASLPVGRVRYGVMLDETGRIIDDGVVARLAPDRFLLSPSSGHVAQVVAALEEWLQCEWVALRVAVEDVTHAWGTVAVSGPCARAVVQRLGLAADLSAAALPHMAWTETRHGGVPIRIARVSFTGEATFELSVPSGCTASLWQGILAAGSADRIAPFGIEALMVLRTEKGYIHVGTDTDGMTEPADIGMPAPRSKTMDFVGKRSLMRPASLRSDRRELVGLAARDATPLPVGAHIVAGAAGAQRSIGYVTSSAFSPILDQPVALALLEAGRRRMGENALVDLFHLGAIRQARVVSPVFYDPEGRRLHA
jgi:sarcosine oxidase subunit alpha